MNECLVAGRKIGSVVRDLSIGNGSTFLREADHRLQDVVKFEEGSEEVDEGPVLHP